MVSLLIAWVANSVAIWLTAQFLPGFSVRNGWKGAFLVALILGLLSAVFGWFLFGLIGIGTLGLGFFLHRITEWLVTAILLVVTDKLSDTLTIHSFGLAFGAAVIITVVSSLTERAIHIIL